MLECNCFFKHFSFPNCTIKITKSRFNPDNVKNKIKWESQGKSPWHKLFFFTAILFCYVSIYDFMIQWIFKIKKIETKAIWSCNITKQTTLCNICSMFYDDVKKRKNQIEDWIEEFMNVSSFHNMWSVKFTYPFLQMQVCDTVKWVFSKTDIAKFNEHMDKTICVATVPQKFLIALILWIWQILEISASEII